MEEREKYLHKIYFNETMENEIWPKQQFFSNS